MAEPQNDIERALKLFSSRAEGYRAVNDYYDGKHRLTFATEKFRNAFGDLFQAFADNLCPKVVDAKADRLEITGFAAEGEAQESAEAAWRIWQGNRMDCRAGEVHTEALLSGDAYVIVWPDLDGEPVFYPNDAALMTVKYDPETPGRILWAAKCWTQDDETVRLTLYYPDRIEKYVTAAKAKGGLPEKSSAFVPFQVEGEPWPLINLFGRVPVFHFGNNARTGRFGRSELADVIPLQNALNKSVADMLVAAEFVAMPQRYAIGLEVDTDEETGKPKTPFVPGGLWTVGSTEAKFGEFSSGDMRQFLEAQAGFRVEIANVSSTPIHFLVPPQGEWPSGESLKTAESEFLAKIRDRQVAFGNTWEDAMAFALRIAGVEGDVKISALWKNPAPRNELQEVQTGVLKKQVGISNEQVQRELGYTEEDIEKMKGEREASAQQLGTELLTAFDRGSNGRA